MINFIIRLLGGVPESELRKVAEQAAKDLLEMKKDTFRKGEKVYITDEKWNQKQQYFLLDSYNDGGAWFIGADMNCTLRRGIDNGVLIKYIQKDQPKACSRCGHIFKDNG